MTKDEEIEKLRIQLAACGVAAMQNTTESALNRITKDNPYWSVSYSDVCDAVDREIRNRKALYRAAGYISGTPGFTHMHPEEVYDYLLKGMK